MHARDFLLKALQDAENQLVQAIAGLDSQAAETRTNPESMTIREQIAHLAEAAVATLAAYEGREHEWGTFDPADRSWSGVKHEWRETRARAVAALPEDESAAWTAYQLLVAHDYYHVGQIAAARRALHPEWDTYSIYTDPNAVTDDGL